MKRITTLLVALLFLCSPRHAQAQAIVPSPFHLDSLASLPAATVYQLRDSMMSHISPSDTNEGGPLDHIKFFETFWSARALANDSSGTNMFTRYYQSFRKAATDKIASPCTDNANWSVFGMDSFYIQDIGKINAVWADTGVDSNYLLAGASGGLFKTTDGGANWHCITDNTLISGGIAGVNHIAVNPQNHNTIFLGTGVLDEENFLESNIVNTKGYGAGILESFDGGNTWTQEFINHNNFDDTVSPVQCVFFTPDSTRLYAFINNDVYTRANNPPGSWQKITPPSGLSGNGRWVELAFVPGDQNHFFITNADGLGAAGIFESKVAVPTDTDWTEITTGLSVIFPDTTTDSFNRMAMSIPIGDTLFIVAMIHYNQNEMTVLKYNIPGTTHSWIRPNNNIVYTEGYASGTKLRIAVSPANPANIYCGSDVPSQSVDGGRTFTEIGAYRAVNNHGDLRALQIQTATNSTHGINDIVYFANDGGVGKKPAGNDCTTLGLSTLVNINGHGLTCGEFLGFDMGLDDKYMVAGLEHDGPMTYERDENPPWINLEQVDGGTSLRQG